MRGLRLAAIALLVAGAGLFAAGTSVERGSHHDEPATGAALAEARGDAEAREQAETHDAAERGTSDEGRILGVDREATGLVILAVLASLALAALLWRRPVRAVWLAAGLVALAFAVFDVAEVVHQLVESDAGLAILAALVAVAHAATAGIAATALRPAEG